jgi:MFS family permease
MNITSSYRWVILGLATLCVVTYAITLQSIPPILGILIDVLHISHTQAGALMSLFVLPAIILALPGGVLIDRYGARITGVASLIVMVLGTAVVALGSSYWVLGLGRLVAGVGAAVLLVIGGRITTSWFQGREIGLAMGVLNCAVPLGTILSLNFLGAIAYRFGWQVPIWLTLAICGVTLCLFLLLFRETDTDGFKRAEPPRLLTIVREAGWGIWWLGMSWGLFTAALTSYFTYAPDYFVSQGKDITQAGLLASYPMWGSIILAPLVGLLIDRTGRKRLFAVVGCIGLAIMLYLIPEFPSHVAFLAISMGLFVAIFSPAIFSLPAELLAGPMMGFGFGIITASQGVGTSLGPVIIGSLRDATGNYLWSFTALSAFAALGVIPVLLIKRRIGRINHSTGKSGKLQ